MKKSSPLYTGRGPASRRPAARASAVKRKQATEGSTAHRALQLPFKRANSGEALKCLRCSADPKSADWPFYEGSKAIGTACKTCWRGYSVGWANEFEWDLWCDECVNNPPFHAKVELACAILNGDCDAPWQSFDITDVAEY